MIFTGFLVDQVRDSCGTEVEHVVEFKQCEAAKPNGGLVGEMVGIAQVMFEGGFERRKSFLVKSEDELFRSGSGENFVEEDFEVRVRHGFQTERPGFMASCMEQRPAREGTVFMVKSIC